DRVAMVLPDGAEAAVATIAVACHAACAPLNPAYRKAELEQYLAILKPRALLVPAGSGTPAIGVARALGITTLELVPLGAEAGVFEVRGGEVNRASQPAFAGPGDIALALFTSGTHHAPK